MTKQNIDNIAIDEIKRLHQAYLDIKENMSYMKRDGTECKAYHAWYDAAYVFFNSIPALHDSKDFSIFTNAEKDGNCFVLEHIYTIASALRTKFL